MKLSRSFFLGALGVLVAGSALAQFGTNYPMSITANTAFGTNAPGSLTASNRFGTNAPGWLTASNSFGTNAPGWLMASNSFGTNAPGFLTASNSFGTNHPGSLTATNVFGTNAPGSLTASNTFSGGAQRVGVVSTNWVTITNSSTNYLVLAGNTYGAGDYYASNSLYYGTNGFSFSFNGVAGGIWIVVNPSGQAVYSKYQQTNPTGEYSDNGWGSCVVSNGTGTFLWNTTTQIITTNYP